MAEDVVGDGVVHANEPDAPRQPQKRQQRRRPIEHPVDGAARRADSLPGLDRVGRIRIQKVADVRVQSVPRTQYAYCRPVK